MKILHIVPGVDDAANGMAVVARLLAREQGNAEVVDLKGYLRTLRKCASGAKSPDEVWVHGMWLPKEWFACRQILKTGRRLVRMTHGSLSPLYLTRQHPFMKRLASPIERYYLRKANKIVATCDAEKEWIERYLRRCCLPIEILDIKRFFNLQGTGNTRHGTEEKELHLLYLGRRHPLKGLEYLEEAVKQVQNLCVSAPLREIKPSLELKIVSNAFGEEKERVWDWCDVLVLPTLSENFGLVVAEALERGKRVITTDGAPAWGDDCECKMENEKCKIGEHGIKIGEQGMGNGERNGLEGEIWTGYDGRLVYLKGYRDGTAEERVGLLKAAIERVSF